LVKIRLTRMGAKKRPFYRLVVADSRSPRDGRFIETLGTYDPLPDPAKIEIDAEKVRAWLAKGARPSDSARQVLMQQGILPRPPMVAYPPKDAPVEEPKPAAATSSAAAADEAPAADAAPAEPEPEATEV